MDASLIPKFEVETTWKDVFTEGPNEIQELTAKPWYPYFLVIMCVLLVLALPGNVLTIFAFFKYPQLQTPTNYFICNQSFADILFILTAQFLSWIQYSSAGLQLASQDRYACLFSLWTTFYSLLISLTNICCLSLERLIAVVWSLEYFTFVTEQKVKWSILVSWKAVVANMSVPLLGWNTWQAGDKCIVSMVYHATYTWVNVLLVAIILFLITCFNIIICFIAASKQHTAIPHWQPPPHIAKPITSSSVQPEMTSVVQRMNAHKYKITKMFLMVVGVFCLSVVPCLLLTTIHILAPVQSWKVAGYPNWFRLLHDVSKCFLVLYAVCNPFIYAKRNKQFKIAFMRSLGRHPSNILNAELGSVKSHLDTLFKY